MPAMGPNTVLYTPSVAGYASNMYFPKSDESTIGTIITNNISESGQTGNISYETFMDKLVGETQNYFNTVVSKNKEVTTQYNNALRQQWMLERNYIKGNMTVTAGPSNVNLFGKPYNFGKRIDEIFLNLLKEIKSKDEAFLQFIIKVN